MKVYLVYEDNHVEGYYFREIFKSKEKAEEYIQLLDKEETFGKDYQWLKIKEMNVLEDFIIKYKVYLRPNYYMDCSFEKLGIPVPYTINKEPEIKHGCVTQIVNQSELTQKQKEIINSFNNKKHKYNNFEEKKQACVELFKKLDFK